jgi:hypothetical protein
VSSHRFTPVTSGLLARKGLAAPSVIHVHSLPTKPLQRADGLENPANIKSAEIESGQIDRSLLQHEMPHYTHDAHHDDPGKPRKLFVAMSYGEYERLSIASVKTGLSKHEIVRDALDRYFDKISHDLGKPCACIASDCSSKCS